MSFNAEDLKAKLQSVAKETTAPAEGAADGAAAQTAQFEGKAKKVIDADTKQKLAAVKESTANMIAEIKAAGSGKTSGTERRIRDTVSKKAYIAGYVTKNDSKIDFATKKSGNDNVDIIVKQYAPSKIELVMVMMPEGLLSLFDQQNADDFVDRLSKYTGATSDTLVYQLMYIPWVEFTTWMLSYTNGYIGESDDLFAPYYAKNKKINTLGDVESVQGIPNGSYIYIASRNAKDESKMFIIKHTFRSKILAPGNYISMERFKEVTVPTTFTEDEAARFIRLYMNRFTKATKTKAAPITRLSPDAQANIVVDATNNTIKSTTFFPTSGASYFADPAHAIKHWAKKKMGPNDTVVDETLTTAKLSAKTETKTNKNGVESVKYSYEKEKLRGADATISSYHCDAVTFPKLFKSTKNLLTYNDLSMNMASLKSTGASSGKGKGKAKAVRNNLIGSELIGVDRSKLLATLQESAAKRKELTKSV